MLDTDDADADPFDLLGETGLRSMSGANARDRAAAAAAITEGRWQHGTDLIGPLLDFINTNAGEIHPRQTGS